MQKNPREPPQHFHICDRAAVYEAQGTRQQTLVDELRKTRAYPTSSPTAWSNPLLVRSSVSLQDSCSATSQPSLFQSDNMAPKKMQPTLQMDLRMHIQWIEENLKTLQSREGVGLRGKLRQGKNIQERKLYQWLIRHETSIQLSPILSATLRALDAQVNISPHMEYLLGLNLHPRLPNFIQKIEDAILTAIKAGQTHKLGLLNLGQTCYINAVLQCLYNTESIRTQIEASSATDTPMRERLCILFRTRSNPCSSWSHVITSLIEFLVTFFNQVPTLTPGELANAEECLTYILQDIKLQHMDSIVHTACASWTTSSPTQPLPITYVLEEVFRATTQQKRTASNMVVYLDPLPLSTMEPQPRTHAINWASTSIHVQSPINKNETRQYNVTSFVQYRPPLDALPYPKRHGGHYVAFIKKHCRWFEFDDSLLTEHSQPPSAFPSLIFLEATRHECAIGPDDTVNSWAASEPPCTRKRKRLPSAHECSTSCQYNILQGDTVSNA